MSDLRGVDVNLIVVLDAILTERNLTRAGEAIGLTQPAVSGAVAKLRKLLGDPLLVRSGRTSELTPRAAALVPIVHEAMLEIGRTLDVRPSFDPRTSDRQFRLSASDYALAVMTAPLLAVLEEEAPGVSIEFGPLGAIGPVDLLRDDVVVASAAHGVPGKRQSLFSDEMVCIVRRGHPRAGGGMLTAADLAELPYVRVSLAEGVVMFADDTLAAAGIRPQVARTVPGFLPVPFTVSGTDMFGFVPARLAERYGDELELAVVRIPVPLPVLVESVFWHPSRSDDPAVRWLLGILRTVAERVEFAEPAR
ncbi:MAG: LysR family transcriptional regulator [Microbacterium sp.]|uniref:LysR family transcriptional regulator n=1 Tax=Microbacterium sp. TaxID=51671 RepID=UPI0039E4AFED